MKKWLSLLLLLFSVFSHGSEDVYRNKYLKAENKENKEEALLEWIAYSTQHNISQADSLIRSQVKSITGYTAETRFKVYLYGLINLDITRLQKHLPLSALNLYSDTVSYYLLKGYQDIRLGKKIDEKIKTRLKAERKNFKDPDKKVLYALIFGHDAFLNGNEHLAEKYYFEALKHAKRANIEQLTSAALEEIAAFYAEKEDFEQAVKFHQRGLDLAKKDERYFCQAFHYYKLGEIYLDIKNYRKAQNYLSNALHLSKEVKAFHLEGMTLAGIGSIHESTDKIKEAISYYQQALIRFYKMDNIEGIAEIHKELGRAHFKNKNYDLAENNYNLSYNYLKDIRDLEKLAELYHWQAELNLATGEIKEAENKVLRAIDILENDGSKATLYKCYLLYSRINEALKNYKEAYYYLDEYSMYQDSFYSQQTQEKLAELSELYESEQKEKQILEQKREIIENTNEQLLKDEQLRNIQLRNNQMIIVLAFSFVLFVSVLIIIYFRSQQNKLQKKQHETELKQKLLRSQMNPHFIFNSMSIIQSYIYEKDLSNSSKFLVSFSRLMRLILENSSKEYIRLTVEVEILQRYLEIQKQRFEDRFDFEIVNEQSIDEAVILIPPMLLQPFIENSLEHGELDKIKNGKIRISYKIENDLLIFAIEDNGIGRLAAIHKKTQSSGKEHKSMAIDITESRIELLNDKYKKAGFLFIQDLNEIGRQGTKVTVATPFQINK